MKLNNLLRTFLILFIASIFGTKAIAQTSNSTTISEIKEYLTIQTDRDVYFSGENVWFSVYYNLGNNSYKTSLSAVIYVELINCNNGSAQVQKKYNLTDFNTNGVITVPKEVPTGNYLLRAYTRYQRNFSDLGYGYKFLTIINPKNNSGTLANWLDSDSIWIVPEGNTLIDQVKNKVIIRIPDSLAITENRFFINDQNQERIDLGNISRLGVLTTEQSFDQNKSYILTIETPAGKTFTKSFPVVVNEGFQTNITRTGSNVNYIIQSNGLPINSKTYQVNLYTKDYKKIHSREVELNNLVNYVSFDESAFNNGINYIVLEKPNGDIEKINSFYVGYKKPTEIQINLADDDIKTRQRVRVSLNKGIENDESKTGFSISVAKKGSTLINEKFKPSFYLSHPILIDNYIKNNSLTDQEIDQIMILFDKTISKELFKKNIFAQKDNVIEYFPETRGLTISGILQNKKTKAPVSDHDVYLSVLYNNPQLHIYKTNANGEFVFSLNQLTGINDVFISPITDVTDDYEVLVKSSFSNEYPDLKNTPSIFSLADKKAIEDLYINYQLQQNFCSIGEIHEKNRVKSSQFNINESKSVYKMKDYIQFESFEEIFIEIVTEAKINKSGGQLSFDVYDKNSNILPGNPLVLVDYLPVFDFNKLLTMHVSQIEKVEVIGNTYILGPNIINGIILITTNSENFAEIDFPKSSIFMEYQTLESDVDYSDLLKSCATLSENLPDFRTTLYWNPKLIINNENNSINFTTSDSKGIYEIIIKGISPNGLVYFGKKEFVVE
ncbi:MAG: hypothetical protein AB7S50_00965 [Bacteroidales bacterium]